MRSIFLNSIFEYVQLLCYKYFFLSFQRILPFFISNFSLPIFYPAAIIQSSILRCRSNSHPINYPQPRPTVELPRENTGLRQPVTFSDGMGWLVYTRTWSLECRRTLRIFYSNHESWSHFVRGKTKK